MSAWDRLQAAAEREYGEAWLPHKNADHPRTLVGTVRGYEQGPVSSYTGEKPWIASVEDCDGKDWSVWLNTAVLISEFERKRPMPDEKVAIAYKGVAEKASQSGMAAPHLYRVIVKRETALPSFMAGELAAGDRDTGMVRRDLELTGETDIPDTSYGSPPIKGRGGRRRHHRRGRRQQGRRPVAVLMSPEQAAAIWLSKHGLAVVPLHRQVAPGVCSCRKGAACGTPGKHPRIRWKERPAQPATPDELDRWFTRTWSDSRIGTILGDHYCAFDVDEHGDTHGLDELHDLERTFGPLPDTWRALTPSDGLHIYFQLRGEVAATTHMLRDGVELRAGRHVMACPPSDGREWEIAPGEVPLAPLPGWVPQYLRERHRAAGSRMPIPYRLGAGWRHDTYVSAARSMARSGFPGEAIFAALKVTDRLRGDPPKNDDDELQQIATWAADVQAGEDAEDDRLAVEIWGA